MTATEAADEITARKAFLETPEYLRELADYFRPWVASRVPAAGDPAWFRTEANIPDRTTCAGR